MIRLKWVQLFQVLVFSVGAAASYGIIHDLITANICLEYFSEAHPMLIPAFTYNPTLQALQWGIVATWWVGAAFGFFIWVALSLKDLQIKPKAFLVHIFRLQVITGMFALIGGCIGFLLAHFGLLRIPFRLQEVIEPSLTARFYFDVFAHSASYLFGLGLGIRMIRDAFYSPQIEWARSQSVDPKTGLKLGEGWVAGGRVV